MAETEALVDGVRLLGPSKWAEIKKLQVGNCNLQGCNLAARPLLPSRCGCVQECHFNSTGCSTACGSVMHPASAPRR